MRLPNNSYKLVWFVDPKDGTEICSELYTSKEAALDASAHVDGRWLVMKLTAQDSHAAGYVWKILPYGSYKTFRQAVRMANLFKGMPRKDREKISRLIGEEASTETRETTVKELQKSQDVRVLDLVLVTPTLIIGGVYPSNLPMWLRGSLIAIGVATFVYNGNNYLKNLKSKPLTD